jgi:hypothetical protein
MKRGLKEETKEPVVRFFIELKKPVEKFEKINIMFNFL